MMGSNVSMGDHKVCLFRYFIKAFNFSKIVKKNHKIAFSVEIKNLYYENLFVVNNEFYFNKW